jgi:hypothetical protein
MPEIPSPPKKQFGNPQRRYRNSSLAELVSEHKLQQATGRSGYEIRLFREWPLIIGDALGHVSEPSRLHSSTRHGGAHRLLHLHIEHGWNLEFQHQEQVIIEKIAAYFGFALVHGLRLHIRALGRQQAAASLGTTARVDVAPHPMVYQEEEISRHASLKERLDALARCLQQQHIDKKS